MPTQDDEEPKNSECFCDGDVVRCQVLKIAPDLNFSSMKKYPLPMLNNNNSRTGGVLL